MDGLALMVFLGSALVLLAALGPRKSRRVQDNVIQFVPRSSPPKVRVEAAGQVIEFKKGK